MKDNQHKQPDVISGALRVVQEGLKSMQSLHRQTAETHKKFLETQTQASRTLQQMMENTQRLAEASLGLKPSNMINITDTPEVRSTLTSPVKNPEDSSIQPVVEPEMEPEGEDTTPLPSNIQQELEDTMLEVVSRLTGYPVEMLGLDMDIEADLGIDSIKRVEILSTLEETMPNLPPVSPEIMGTLKTLGQIAEYLAGATSNEKPHPVLEAVCSCAPSSAPECERQPISEYLSENIERRIVSITAEPVFQGATLSIPSGRKVYITDDKTGLSHAIAEEFVSFEIDAIVVSPDRLKDPIDLPQAAGLVIVANPDSEFETSDLKDAFVLAKQVAPDLLESAGQGGAIFSTITRLDGAFGFIGRKIHNPVQGGLAGLAKTAAIEWERVCCRAIDIQPDWKEINAIARAVVRELLNPDPEEPVEIGLAPESRLLLELESAPCPDSLNIELELNPENVVVVTGGAKGVTASVVRAMAKYTRPVFVLIGRSPHPVPEPDWLLPLSDEAEIKKAIFEYEFKGNAASPKQIEKAFKKHMANREISKNLEKIKETGATVLYYSADVRDPSEVGRILAEVRSAYGSIRGIIHGAGVLEDRYIIDKTPEQFEKVLDTKVKGLQVLLAATQQDPLKYLVLFSSVSARFGNKGQVDYAMANEVLNKIAQHEAITRPDCRVVSINWGPWDGGMVSPALKREFTRNKIGLIPMDAGPMYMLQEMLGNHRSPVEVVIGASIRPEKVKTAPPISTPEESKRSKQNEDLALTFSREVDVERYPILGSHILDGKPVVPLALMTEWLGHGALHENPGLLLYGIDDMRLLQGIKIDKGKKMIRLLSGKAKKTGLVYEVDVEIRDGIKDGAEVIHSKAKAILADNPLQPPVYDPSAVIESKAYHRSMDEVYEKILFHGLELRGIKEITRYSDKGMVARISTAPAPAKWMNEPLRSKWIGDPLVLDCAFQMAIIWTFEKKGLASLPSYYASYRQYCDSFPAEGVTAVMEVQETARHKIRCDYTFLNQDNTVVARIEGYEAIMDPSLLKAFKPGETS
ncbi:MAG: SDR family NAD(P)-dependent oxidoreductase [Deltaproteobacteria bacterium]|nr:SDR family NAD(P)-dependent oxidoreductase [Deltaproteobacteria bacterium]